MVAGSASQWRSKFNTQKCSAAVAGVGSSRRRRAACSIGYSPLPVLILAPALGPRAPQPTYKPNAFHNAKRVEKCGGQVILEGISTQAE
jgi:hypothetical protein